jgi:hypothetical protein
LFEIKAPHFIRLKKFRFDVYEFPDVRMRINILIILLASVAFSG